MPEDNGNERDARLERLEKEHEVFQRDLQQLLTAQVLQQDALDRQAKLMEKHVEQSDREFAELRAHGREVDERLDKLISAIGNLISRVPPLQA